MKGEAGERATGQMDVSGGNRPFAVFTVTFCFGWLLQTLGGALAFVVAPLSQLSGTLYTFLMLAFVIVSGVEFFTGAGGGISGAEVAEAAAGNVGNRAVPAQPVDAAAAEAPAPPNPVGAFCTEHGLSQRETEVFRLWISGHGVRDITDKLAMSESTAKTHVRHIYDKCGVYGKAKLLAAYEEWQAGNSRL